MKIKLLGIVAILSGLTVVACGDDSGSGGSGTTSATTTSTGGTTKSTTTGGTTTGMNTGSTTTGGMAGPCDADCMSDPGCAMDPANPSGACATCVQMQADNLAECAVSILSDPNCQNDMDCSDYVDCVLAQGTTCEMDFPDGAALAQAIVLLACGNCGDGNP